MFADARIQHTRRNNGIPVGPRAPDRAGPAAPTAATGGVNMRAFQDHVLPYDPGAAATVWLMYLAAALVYFSPTVIAFIRNVEHRWLLYFCNLLLGFTGIGWAYCLYCAIFAETEHGKLPTTA